MESPNTKTVSIIVLTYNSEITLERCLDSIKTLDYPKDRFELLILDNGSNDKTIQIINRFGSIYYSLPNLNLSELRNYGADVSTGEILSFVDSDCVLSPVWLTQVVKWFDDPVVGIVGNEYLLPENASIFERNWYNKSNYGIKYNELIPAGNMAIRKDFFLQSGGFDTTLLTGEDDYILRKFRSAGFKTISDHRIKSVHLGNAKNLWEYFKKETWYGLGMLGTLHLSQWDKPLIATIAFFLSFLLSCIFLIFYFVTASSYLLVPATCAFLCSLALPLLSAIDRVYRKKRKGNLFFVMLIFIVFFMARFKSLFNIMCINYRR